ncbi:MAG: type I restriction-modification system subunit M N-terminal domain-containing protein, partial [Elusimicrobiota bacterium]
MSTKTNMNLQNWLEQRYDDLCSKYQKQKFEMEEVASLFNKKYQHNKDEVSAILSELRKAGRIKTALNPDDNRKRIYQMILPEEIISDQLSVTGKELTRSELYGLLKKAADLIRTRVDYKFILVLLFYKRVSDKWQDAFEREYKKALKDGLSEEEASVEAGDSSYHDFDLLQDFLWENLRKDVNTL